MDEVKLSGENKRYSPKSKINLFFLHIPKTAGTSFSSYLEQHFQVSDSIAYNFPDLDARLARADFVWGHVSYDCFMGLKNADRFHTAVIVRSPFARLASNLQFTDRYNDPRFADELNKLDESVQITVRQVAKVDFDDPNALAEFFASLSPWGMAAFDNCQVRFLTDTPRPPHYLPRQSVSPSQVEKAVASLQAFDFLGTTDDLSSCASDIAAACGHPAKALTVLNVGDYGRRVNWRDPAIREAMSPLLQGDVAVYERARELVDQRRSATRALLTGSFAR